MFKKISGNFPKKIKECSKRFGGIFEKIPENVFEKSGEMLKRFCGRTFKKIPVNVWKDCGECWRRLDAL